jgi:hypothetical protein
MERGAAQASGATTCLAYDLPCDATPHPLIR